MSQQGSAVQEVRSPSDHRVVVGTVPAMTAGETRSALERSVAAQPAWAALSPVARGAVLLRAAQLLRERSDSIAHTVASEMGKSITDARLEAASAADFAEFFGGLGRAPQGEVLPDPRAGVQTTAVREPVGVVLVITPWNDPVVTPLRKLGPALIAGNAAVLKPAGFSPLSAYAVQAALSDAGLPDGVLEVVTGPVATTVEAIIDDPRIAAVTFTGSTAVGRRLRSRLAEGTARLQTEMGGKNAAVVLEDADLDLAADTIAGAAFGQSGQRCTATSRVLVHRSVASELVDRVGRRALALRPGPATDDATTLGPVVSEDARTTMLSVVGRAVDEGAHLVTGGRELARPDLSNGWYLEPTVLTQVQPTNVVWSTELFGPVLAVTEFDTLDEAIELANDSDYGLSAAVFTTSLASAHAFATRVSTGQVSVNLPTSGWPAHLPFGGWKDSGSAHKEQGAQALDFYTRLKTVAVRAV